MFRSLDRPGTPVPTLRALRAADYSVLLQSGGPMFLPRRYRSFHVIAVPLSADYAIVRGQDVGRWHGRLTFGEVSVHGAGRGDRIVWPDGVSCLYIHLRPAFVARRQDGARAVGIGTQHRVRDPVIRDIGMTVLELVGSGTGETSGPRPHGRVRRPSRRTVLATGAATSPSRSANAR
jgi:hypothetical protein